MRAYLGIGCHYMVQWMDRSTEGFAQMGGEGANWIGEAPFSKRAHVFQNLGDGPYDHSGTVPRGTGAGETRGGINDVPTSIPSAGLDARDCGR